MAGFCRQTRGHPALTLVTSSQKQSLHAVILRVHVGRRACGETAEDGFSALLFCLAACQHGLQHNRGSPCIIHESKKSSVCCYISFAQAGSRSTGATLKEDGVNSTRADMEIV